MDTPPRKRIPTDLLWLILGLALGAAVWLGYGYWQQPEPVIPPALEHGTWLPEPQPIPDVTLQDHHGAAFTRERLRDHWTFAFFGYTHCPDVCPTTMAVLGGMVRQLAEQGIDAPQVVFVTVDPERDTVEQLSRFVPYFNPDFLGVTGPEAEIDRLTRSLGIVYGKVEENRGEGYLVDHSAAILLFDPQGRFAALFSAPHKPAELAADYRRILQRHEAD